MVDLPPRKLLSLFNLEFDHWVGPPMELELPPKRFPMELELAPKLFAMDPAPKLFSVALFTGLAGTRSPSSKLNFKDSFPAVESNWFMSELMGTLSPFGSSVSSGETPVPVTGASFSTPLSSTSLTV